MVKSAGFRLASILIPTLLLLVLGGVVYLVLRDNPATLRPATQVMFTPENGNEGNLTPPPPTPSVFLVAAVAPVRLDGMLRYTEADLAFGPPQGYLLDLAEQAAILTANDGSPAAGTILVLRNEAPDDYGGIQMPDDALFDEFVRYYAEQDNFALGESATLTVGGQPGWAIDLVSRDDGTFSGRIALTRPRPDRLFVMIGVGPTSIWVGQGLADYMAVLETVTFLGETTNGSVAAAEPTPTPAPAPTAMPTPSPTSSPPVTEAPVTPDDATGNDATGDDAAGNDTETNNATVEIPAADTPAPRPTPIPTAEPLTLDPGRWSVVTNGNFVNRLAVRQDTLWAATSGGAVAWNLTSGNHVKFTTADGLATNHLTAVAICDLPGFGVVFGGDRGLQVYAPDTSSWRVLTAQSGDLAADDVVDVYCDAQAGYLAVLYPRAGIDLYDANAQVWTHLALDMAQLEAEVGLLRRITGTASGNALWVAAQRGLLAIRGDFGASLTATGAEETGAEETGAEETGAAEIGAAEAGAPGLLVYTPANSPLINESVTALTAAGGDAIWLASNGAFYRTDGENWETFTADTITGETITGAEFPQGRINGLRVDGEGALWIASDQANICRFDPAAERCVSFYINQEGMAQGPLSSLALDAQGRPYYGTVGNGVSLLDDDTWRMLFLENQLPMGNTVRSFALDAGNALWIGANSGATRIDPASPNQPTHYTPGNSPLPFADVTVVGAGASGVWFGAGSAANLDGGAWRLFGPEDNLVAANIQAIAADGVGRTWLGSQGAGISIWTGSNFFNLTSANGLPSQDITALAAAGDVIWIGTRGGGLLRFQNNQLRFYNTRDTELPSNTITALTVHPNGSLLIGTDRGLARYADESIQLVAEFPAGAVTALAVPPTSATGVHYWAVRDATTLYYFDGVDFETGTLYIVQPVTGWSPAPVSALAVDATGVLWMGFQRGGLARYTP